MTPLTRAALARTPLTVPEVEAIYRYCPDIHREWLTALCESHERLREELRGAKTLIAQDAEVRKALDDAIRMLEAAYTRLGERVDTPRMQRLRDVLAGK
jgi:hypothetical protein